MEDQIALESVKTPGQYLHASLAAYEQLSEEGLPSLHELNLSVDQSSYIIKPFRFPRTIESSDTICGGDVIQMSHKEIGAYIAAEGLHSSVAKPIEDVHLRIRAPDSSRPSRSAPPTSAVSFWQVENESPANGTPIKWEDAGVVRFRHLTTQLYLSFPSISDNLNHDNNFDGFLNDGDHNDILTAKVQEPQANSDTIWEQGVSAPSRQGTQVFDASGRGMTFKLAAPKDASERKDTLFRLHPVIQEKNTRVVSGTYCRIQHVATGYWVHGTRDEPYLRKEKPPDYVDCGEDIASLAAVVKQVLT